MPAGRPTKYKPEFCEELIEHMGKGLSFESFAGVIEVSKQTIYDWEKANQEFLDAKHIGSAKSQIFWEQKGIDGLFSESSSDEDGNRSSKSMNASVWIFNMKNRFGWRDKQPGEEDHTVKHEGGIKIEQVDLDERIKQLKGEGK